MTIEGRLDEYRARSDALAKLPALADRLGVKEYNGPATWLLQTGSGKRYCVFELINAVLDRVEAK